jgi:integrase
MTDSTRRRDRGKPSRLRKPRKDFPLSIHQGTGYWCRKVWGKVYYFGKVADDPKGVAALDRWLEVKDDRIAGREPRAVDPDPDALSVADLCNQFLSHHEERRNNGEISPRTFQGHYATCRVIVEVFGENRAVTSLTPVDFGKLRKALAKTRGVVALRNEIQRIRGVLKFAFDNSLILHPIRFGTLFAKPSKATVRRDRETKRAKNGDRMFEAAELREILAASGQPLRAMILIAANSGFGQTDLSTLPLRAVNLKTGWLDFARVKTAVPRRIPLWSETVASIRDWLAVRPKAKDSADAGLLFVTCRGQRWVKLNKNGTPSDALGQEFTKVLSKLNLKRPGVSFYALRHGFETVAGETTDQVAVDAIMGHVPQGMASAYRERISDERLRRVVEHVRQWLFGDDGGDTTGKDDQPEVLPHNLDQTVTDDNSDVEPALRLFVG